MQTSRIVTRRLRRQSIVFGLLMALSLAMLAGSNTAFARDLQGGVQYAFLPITSTINGIADGVGSLWTAIVEIDHLRSDNDRLRSENEALKRELDRIPEIQLLNDDWNAITQTQKFVPYATMPAAVLVRDVTGPERTVIIDRGSRDGIKLNQVVIAAGGALVGRVVDVGPATAQIRLINDVQSVVTGKTIDPTGEVGTATGEIVGQVGGLLEMRNVDANDTLTKGQQVVTAGFSTEKYRSLFPAALLIGRVVDVSRDANSMQQTAYLEPSVDFSHVQYVLVITNYEGGLSIDVGSQAPGASATPAPSGPKSSGSPRPSAKPSPTRH